MKHACTISRWGIFEIFWIVTQTFFREKGTKRIAENFNRFNSWGSIFSHEFLRGSVIQAILFHRAYLLEVGRAIILTIFRRWGTRVGTSTHSYQSHRWNSPVEDNECLKKRKYTRYTLHQHAMRSEKPVGEDWTSS